MPASFDAIYTSVLILVCLVLGGLVLLLFTRVYSDQKQRRSKVVLENFRRIFHDRLSGSQTKTVMTKELIFRDSDYDDLAYVYLCHDDLLNGEARIFLRNLALDLSLDVYAQDMLKNRVKTHQLLLGLAVAGKLGLSSCLPNIKALIGVSDASISFQAAKSLIEIEQSLLGEILESMIVRVDWSISKCEMILRKIDQEKLKNKLNELVLSGRYGNSVRMIFICGMVQNNLSLLKHFLSEDQDEDTLAVSIRAMNDVESLPQIRVLLRHRSWVVRCQAAKFLERFALQEDIPLLAELLADKYWWVRYRAALALSSLPGVDLSSMAADYKLDTGNLGLLESVGLGQWFIPENSKGVQG
jgi:hypothetical protein